MRGHICVSIVNINTTMKTSNNRMIYIENIWQQENKYHFVPYHLLWRTNPQPSWYSQTFSMVSNSWKTVESLSLLLFVYIFSFSSLIIGLSTSLKCCLCLRVKSGVIWSLSDQHLLSNGCLTKSLLFVHTWEICIHNLTHTQTQPHTSNCVRHGWTNESENLRVLSK